MSSLDSRDSIANYSANKDDIDDIKEEQEEDIERENVEINKALKCKSSEINDFNINYNKLLNKYNNKKNKIIQNQSMNLNQTKSKITESFKKLYDILETKENQLLFELDEIYKSKRNKLNEISKNHETYNINKNIYEYTENLNKEINHFKKTG